MQSFDPIHLQRLVDGELDRDETRKMLELAENNPILWREMASAYAENQLWESGFRKLELGIEPDTKKSVSRITKRAQLPINRISWLALAAGMMLALTAGMLIGRFNNSGIRVTDPRTTPHESMIAELGQPADEAPALSVTDMPGHTLVNYRPDYQLELEDANGNRVFDTEVPLFNLATANQAGYRVDRQPALPPELVKRAVRSGYWMDQDVNYVSGRLGDGRMFVVPVRTVNLVRGQ